uniref:15-oxoprostaglandin 13-reductase n=1 Tax=Timema bartmani TaxID=61472 RepID=A0A7R9F8T1_9NEOP|nr:unnamed protein product [Timema bartmani]
MSFVYLDESEEVIQSVIKKFPGVITTRLERYDALPYEIVAEDILSVIGVALTQLGTKIGDVTRIASSPRSARAYSQLSIIMSYAHLEARFKVITGRVNRLYKLSEQVQGDITKLELFKAHCSDLEHLRRDFEETHVELGVAASKSKRDFDVEAHDKLIEDFDMTYYQVKEIYARITKPSSTSGNDNGTPVKALSAKLPKLQLPTFSGINTDWTTFHDLYVSLIHTNKTLTPVERFQYLLTTLSGEPLSLLKSLPVSDENYPLAWATLTERYQDVRSIATTHLEKIMQFPGLTSRSPQNLRALVDTFKENLGALNVLKFPVCEWSFILLNLTLNKLDRETRLMFELAHTATKLPSFDQLLEFLENQCKALSSANQGDATHQAHSPGHEGTVTRGEHINSLTTSSVSLTTVLLGTAVVQVKDGHGAYQKVRVLIDCASQSSFITEDCAHRLCLPRRNLKIPIRGISQSTVQTNKGVVICEVRPCGVYGPQLITEAIILSKITSGMPSTMLSKDMVQEFAHLQLADPHFHVPGPIDILLGADVYPEIFDAGMGSKMNIAKEVMTKAKKFILAKHFDGEPKESDLKLVEEELPPIKDGEILAEAVWLSVDPYMRPYSVRLPIGTTMIGSQVAK